MVGSDGRRGGEYSCRIRLVAIIVCFIEGAEVAWKNKSLRPGQKPGRFSVRYAENIGSVQYSLEIFPECIMIDKQERCNQEARIW